MDLGTSTPTVALMAGVAAVVVALTTQQRVSIQKIYILLLVCVCA